MKLISIVMFAGFMVGCSSAPSRPTDLYLSAISKLKDSDYAHTQALFEKACNGGATAACLVIGKSTSVINRLSILQGATTGTSTRISLVVPTTGKFDFLFWDMADHRLIVPTNMHREHRSESDWIVITMEFSGLAYGKAYRLDVLKGGELIDSRELATLDLQQKTVTIAVASGLDDQSPQQSEIRKRLLEERPDLVFLVGDTVYATQGLHQTVTPARLWRRYVETRNNLDFFHSRRLIPTLAIWNDFDYGAADGDTNSPNKLAAQQIFRSFYPQDPLAPAYEQGPGVALAFSGFGQQFIFLDNRSFRTTDGRAVIGETHFGQAQENWLLKRLQELEPAWIISGDAFFGGFHEPDNYAGAHPISFAAFVKKLHQIKTVFIFVSGNRKRSEMHPLGKKNLGLATFELTVAPIHAEVDPSFALVHSRVRNQYLNTDVDIWGPQGLWEKHKIKVHR